jgi:hypothetical protein
LRQPETAASTEHLAALPRLPIEKNGPVFAEPWQARAFARALKLSEQRGISRGRNGLARWAMNFEPLPNGASQMADRITITIG